jgi:hypothetical protein
LPGAGVIVSSAERGTALFEVSIAGAGDLIFFGDFLISGRLFAMAVIASVLEQRVCSN